MGAFRIVDVSIVITAYNYASYLKECIESCLFQDGSCLEYEVSVVDDGSTDQTPSVLEGLTNSKLRKYRIENCGIEKASNYGFRKACGSYIVRVDADDRLSSSYLHDIQPHLKDEFGFFYPDYAVIDATGEVIEKMALPEFQAAEVLQRGDFLATGTLFSAKILREAAGYSTTIKNGGLENYELILRLIKAGVRGKHIPFCLFGYRRHSLNISVTKEKQIVRNGKLLFLRMKLGSFTTNEYHPYKLRVGTQ